MASDNKRIAKNTMFLYIRMFLIMAVTLYTSRVILNRLGVEDYGLYNVVGGVVGMLSFLNGTLSTGSSRFITFSLGEGDRKKLGATFSTAFYAHLGLSLILVLLLETIGLWFVYNKLVIPPDRFDAAIWVYHISIITMVMNITQVPYTADIMAHERMGIYAYVSIFDTFAKLAVCYAISLGSIDKLILYSILLAIVQIADIIVYRIYCVRNFEESRLSTTFDKSVFKEMMSFSGWNIIANITEVLNVQGVVVLMNLFFQPAIVGAQAFATQVSNAMMQFITNFRQAINPQIIKQYAAQDFEGSKRLTLSTTVYVYDLILLLGLPCFFSMPIILDIWLVEVPEYALFFCRWFIIYNILVTFSTAFYVPMMAAAKVKTNSFASIFLGVGKFVILYLLWKFGCGVEWVQYTAVISIVLYGFVVKPYILVNECKGYTWKEIWNCILTCIKITLLAIILPLLLYLFIDNESLLQNFVLILITAVSVSLASLIFMEKQIRNKLFLFLKSKLNHI